MRVLIDHTSVNAIELCLDGKATDGDHAITFMDVMASLIYSENLLLSGFCDEKTLHNSRRIIGDLEKIGLDNTFQFCRTSEADFRKACDEAINNFGSYLRGLVENRCLTWPDETYPGPIGIEGEDEIGPIYHLDETVSKHLDDPAYCHNLQNECSKNLSWRTAEYLVCNEENRDLLLSLKKRTGWRIQYADVLDAQARTEVYQLLPWVAPESNGNGDVPFGRARDIVYLANASRQWLAQIPGNDLINRINGMLEDAAVIINIRPLDNNIPSLLPFQQALIAVGEAEPRRILEKAIKYRQVFSRMRETYRGDLPTSGGRDFELYRRDALAHLDINNLHPQVAGKVDFEAKTSIFKPLNASIKLQVETDDVLRIASWLENRHNQEGVASALSDMSRSLRANNMQHFNFQTLYRNCSKNTEDQD